MIGKPTRWTIGLLLAGAIVIVAGIVVIAHRQQNLTIADSSLVGAVSEPSGPHAVDVNFADVAPGPVPAKLGQNTLSTVEKGDNSAPLSIKDGKLSHGNPLVKDSASYLEATLAHPVERLGGTVTFAPYSGSVAFVIWQSPLKLGVDGHDTNSPNAGVHFVAGPGTWSIGVWEAGTGQRVLKSGTYKAAAFGTPEVFDISREGATATIMLPDGQRQVISDPSIAAWSGPVACWELYEARPGLAPASVEAIWAN
ncbi:hypothetical protein FOS14_08330 [Skermania sp. ID1734]|uniref:hypothetical protein n=1 Tax=Skermania sp. ID1734 TaxID=2597516 RepID=UPI00117DE42B|nr:hypothetical protein [Skermania sp. ID1734]TSE00414.1 hypothetical protein FOS14_08330 [Skermania sp. ID1734]